MNNDQDSPAGDVLLERRVRRRTPGWRLPANTVCVSRPSRWGNPFVVGRDGDAAECVRLFERWLKSSIMRTENCRYELRGKHLACWCAADQPCHADVLLRVANEGSEPSNGNKLSDGGWRRWT